MKPDNNTSEELPDALIDRLKSADTQPALITSRVDHQLLQDAATQFSSRRPARKRRSLWLAAAATVLLALFIVQLRPPDFGDDAIAYSDADGSGQIDIADVLFLARKHAGDDAAQAQLDAVAQRIVTLSEPGDI